MLAMLAQFGSGQVLWSILWFFVFFIWIMMLFQVFGDIFRSPDLSGGMKAVWSLFIIFLPYLGVFIYLIARGPKMHENAMRSAQAADDATRAYIRSAAGGTSAADEISRLAALLASGAINDAEFAAAKAKVLAA
jgi:hypothetical protein